MAVQSAVGREQAIRFLFDFDRAEDEISHMRAALRAADDEWQSGVGQADIHPALTLENVQLSMEQLVLEDSAVMQATTSSDEEIIEAVEFPAEAIAMSGYAARSPANTRSALRRVTAPADSPVRRDEARSAALRRNDTLPVAGITAPSRCCYGAMPCRGCDQEMGMGAWMIPGGAGMVHNVIECYQAAVGRRVEAEANLFRVERIRSLRGPGDIELEPVQPLTADTLHAYVPEISPDVETRVRPPKPDKNQKGTQLI